MKRVRRLRVGPVATAALLLAWFLLLRPAALGGPTTWVVIRGDSMLPTYNTGDLVIVRAEPAYAIGDVVAYRVPAGDVGGGDIVIHRLTGGDATGYEVTGDNNDGPDPWRPTPSDIVGRAWISMSGLGRVVTWIHQPMVAGGLAAALVVALVVSRQPGPAGPRRDPRAIGRGELEGVAD